MDGMKPVSLIISNRERVHTMCIETPRLARAVRLKQWHSTSLEFCDLLVVDAHSLDASEIAILTRISRLPVRPPLILIDDPTLPRNALARMAIDHLVTSLTPPDLAAAVEQTSGTAVVRRHLREIVAAAHGATALCTFIQTLIDAPADARSVAVMSRALGLSQRTLRDQWRRIGPQGIRLSDLVRAVRAVSSPSRRRSEQAATRLASICHTISSLHSNR